MEVIEEILLEKITSGDFEQRIGENDEKFNELVKSIGRVGIINPVVVTRSGDGYMVVAGHRRLQACRRLGLKYVRCQITKTDMDKATEITFAENFCRQDLSPVEQAAAIKDCYTKGIMTIEQLAGTFHRSDHWVREQIAMCDWPTEILEVIHDEVLSVAAASNIAMVDDSQYREYLLRNACENGATARTTAAWLQAYRSSKPPQQALEAQPVPEGTRATPMVPQAPCLSCGDVYRTDELSHVPLCQGCIKAIRSALSS